jgi:hypothetical protein
MKNLILFSIAFMLFFATVKAQEISDESINGTSMIVDSTNLEQDMKLLLANDRLYSGNGLIDVLLKQASKEKAETGKVVKAAATQNFIDKLNNAYSDYASKFIKVDTIYVDSLKVAKQAAKIQQWQQTVINDPEIKNVTSLSIWEQKNARLQKLMYYLNKLQNN